MIRRMLLMCSVATFLVSSAGADPNWPQFRGSDSRGVAADGPWPESWSETENVRWKTAIAGEGWSSPVVWDNRIFVTGVVSDGNVEEHKKGLYFGGNRSDSPKDRHHWKVYCVDFNTGKILWEREPKTGTPDAPRHLKNTYASETAVTDGQRVYAYFGGVGVFCYDMKGNEIWDRTIKPTKMRNDWGTAASPVLQGDRLIILNDNDEQSFLLALDKKTGEEIWRVDRDEASNWSNPYIWKNELRTEIVTAGTGKVRSYGLDGELLWELTRMSSITIATPFSEFGMLYISSGYVGDRETRPIYAIRPGASGDITLPEGQTAGQYIAWSDPMGAPYNPTPVLYGDYYYTLLDRGFFTCHNAKTGELVYGKQRIDRNASAFTSSPWAYNGKIFCLSEDGDTYVIQAGPEFEVLGKSSLNEMSMATPALVRGSLIIRTSGHLYRIQEGSEVGEQAS